jgi:uncharacterized protein (DUF58 family)
LNLQEVLQFRQFDNLEFVAKQVVEGFISGLHKSPFHGFSVEFAEHRIYNTGESTKHIDWKLFARTEKLFVKRFEEETNLRAHLVLDTSSSMIFPYKEKKLQNKLSFSIYTIASLIYLLRKQRDAVGLTLFSDKIDLLTDSRLSVVHAQLLYSELNKLLNNQEAHINKKTDLSSTLHVIAESYHKRSLIILFSDFFDQSKPEEIFSALQHLRFNGHEVVVFSVLDVEHELNLKYENRPHKFIDLETGNVLKLNPGEVRDDFVQNQSAFQNELKLKCGQYKIELINVDVKDEFSTVLIPFLIKRSKLF